MLVFWRGEEGGLDSSRCSLGDENEFLIEGRGGGEGQEGKGVRSGGRGVNIVFVMCRFFPQFRFVLLDVRRGKCGQRFCSHACRDYSGSFMEAGEVVTFPFFFQNFSHFKIISLLSLVIRPRSYSTYPKFIL